MANVLITPSVIAKEALMQLQNNLVMGNNVHREYKKDFVKVGDTVSIRKPVKFEAKDGATRVNQDVQEANTSIKIDQRKHVSWNFSTQDLTLSIEEYSERYVKPAAIALANSVDAALAGLYNRVAMHVGTAGTTPASFKAFGTAMRRLNQAAVPTDQRKIVLDPTAELEAADVLRQLYNPEIVKGAVRGYKVGQLAGAEVYMDQNIKAHTKGAGWGTPLVNGASQNVTYANATHTYGPSSQTLNVDGLSASGAVKAGDRFTIANVYSVNPVSKDATNVLQEFVVLADAAADGAGVLNGLAISPAIITSGPYQTVDAAPADNAALTVVANYTANLAFHKNAFALVTCPLQLPDGAAWKAQETHNGISLRVIKDYDVVNDVEICRIDLLFGVKAIYGELATVLLG